MLSGARTERPSRHYFDIDAWRQSQGFPQVSPVSPSGVDTFERGIDDAGLLARPDGRGTAYRTAPAVDPSSRTYWVGDWKVYVRILQRELGTQFDDRTIAIFEEQFPYVGSFVTTYLSLSPNENSPHRWMIGGARRADPISDFRTYIELRSQGDPKFEKLARVLKKIQEQADRVEVNLIRLSEYQGYLSRGDDKRDFYQGKIREIRSEIADAKEAIRENVRGAGEVLRFPKGHLAEVRRFAREAVHAAESQAQQTIERERIFAELERQRFGTRAVSAPLGAGSRRTSRSRGVRYYDENMFRMAQGLPEVSLASEGIDSVGLLAGPDGVGSFAPNYLSGRASRSGGSAGSSDEAAVRSVWSDMDKIMFKEFRQDIRRGDITTSQQLSERIHRGGRFGGLYNSGLDYVRAAAELLLWSKDKIEFDLETYVKDLMDLNMWRRRVVWEPGAHFESDHYSQRGDVTGAILKALSVVERTLYGEGAARGFQEGWEVDYTMFALEPVDLWEGADAGHDPVLLSRRLVEEVYKLYSEGSSYQSEPLQRINDAIMFASLGHGAQLRKGTAYPYIIHPIGVATIIAENGGDIDQIIAGVFHDLPEDTKVTVAEIRAEFGDRVANALEAVVTPGKSEGKSKLTWEQSKQLTIDHIAELPLDALIVEMADKLDNMRAIRADFEALGDGLWTRFKRGKEQQGWYYGSIAAAFLKRTDTEATRKIAREFAGHVRAVFGQSSVSGSEASRSGGRPSGPGSARYYEFPSWFAADPAEASSDSTPEFRFARTFFVGGPDGREFHYRDRSHLIGRSPDARVRLVEDISAKIRSKEGWIEAMAADWPSRVAALQAASPLFVDSELDRVHGALEAIMDDIESLVRDAEKGRLLKSQMREIIALAQSVIAKAMAWPNLPNTAQAQSAPPAPAPQTTPTPAAPPDSTPPAPETQSSEPTVTGLVSEEETGETSGGAFETGAEHLAGASQAGSSHQRVAQRQVAGAARVRQPATGVRSAVAAPAVVRTPVLAP